MGSPILPRSKVAPTDNTKRVKKAFGILNRKYKQLNKRIIPLIEKLKTAPRETVSNAFIFVYSELSEPTLYTLNATVDYDITSGDYSTLLADIDDIIDEILLQGGKRNLFFYESLEEEARKATQASYLNLAAQSAVYDERTSLAQLLTSRPFQQLLSVAENTSYYDWKSLGDNTKKDLANVIKTAIGQGVSTKEAARLIRKRLDVSKSNARRIAQTELLGVYRDARLQESERAQKDYGLNIKLLWTSALIPTTRPWHASRHGKYYTEQQVRDFYAEFKNKVNCYCAQTETLFLEGEPQLSKASQNKMKKEKAAWTTKYGKTT